MRVRFSQSARGHRIGKAHALHVIEHTAPTIVPPGGPSADPQWTWIGLDDRGVELEIVAVVKPDRSDDAPMLLVIHVMPTGLRGATP